MSDEVHPLDEPLGEICEIAIMLSHAYGLFDTALRLARAHEKIQGYLVERDTL